MVGLCERAETPVAGETPDGLCPLPMALVMSGDDVQQLRQEYAFCKDEMISSSAAAKDIIAFTEQTAEPLRPDYPPSQNAWIGGKRGSKGSCTIC